jgi:hypothetical protein
MWTLGRSPLQAVSMVPEMSVHATGFDVSAGVRHVARCGS